MKKRINLGLEDFLSDEQKFMLYDIQKLVLKERWLRRSDHQAHLSDDEQLELVKLLDGFARSCLADLPYIGEIVGEPDFCEEHESVECVDQNMPEANDITNIIHSSCKNREE